MNFQGDLLVLGPGRDPAPTQDINGALAGERVEWPTKVNLSGRAVVVGWRVRETAAS
jgi:hypothetical protein